MRCTTVALLILVTATCLHPAPTPAVDAAEWSQYVPKQLSAAWTALLGRLNKLPNPFAARKSKPFTVTESMAECNYPYSTMPQDRSFSYWYAAYKMFLDIVDVATTLEDTTEDRESLKEQLRAMQWSAREYMQFALLPKIAYVERTDKDAKRWIRLRLAFLVNTMENVERTHPIEPTKNPITLSERRINASRLVAALGFQAALEAELPKQCITVKQKHTDKIFLVIKPESSKEAPPATVNKPEGNKAASPATVNKSDSAVPDNNYATAIFTPVNVATMIVRTPSPVEETVSPKSRQSRQSLSDLKRQAMDVNMGDFEKRLRNLPSTNNLLAPKAHPSLQSVKAKSGHTEDAHDSAGSLSDGFATTRINVPSAFSTTKITSIDAKPIGLEHVLKTIKIGEDTTEPFIDSKLFAFKDSPYLYPSSRSDSKPTIVRQTAPDRVKATDIDWSDASKSTEIKGKGTKGKGKGTKGKGRGTKGKGKRS